MGDSIYDLIVLGAGPAGLTAGIYGHRAGLSVLVLAGDTPGGKVLTHNLIENYPPFPGGVTGAELMIKWIKQAQDEIGDPVRPEKVVRVELQGRIKEINTGQTVYRGRTVIIATGAGPKKLGVQGEERLAGKGVFSCAACDGPLLRTLKRQRAIVVGGGNTALHTALALLPHAESVTLVTRGQRLKALPALIDRFRAETKTNLVLGRKVMAIEGQNWVTGVRLTDLDPATEELLASEAVFVGIGQVPATGFLVDHLNLDQEGYIITDETLMTSAPGVWAAGDVRVTALRQILTAAADGALAGQGAGDYLNRVGR